VLGTTREPPSREHTIDSITQSVQGEEKNEQLDMMKKEEKWKKKGGFFCSQGGGNARGGTGRGGIFQATEHEQGTIAADGKNIVSWNKKRSERDVSSPA